MSSCFPCFSTGDELPARSSTEFSSVSSVGTGEGAVHLPSSPPSPATPPPASPAPAAVQTFSYRELAAATRSFRPECLLGEGGFGRVYRGFVQRVGKEVAVKQLNLNGLQGHREFVVEMMMLSLLHHPNLVSLIGYCVEGDQRLLVYEFMPLGSLEDHLFAVSRRRPPLDWYTRMKVAHGAAKGLAYLHGGEATPPVIYRDLKASNILLDGDYTPKLSDFGLAKLGPIGDDAHVSSRVMGTYGYCAPEYLRTGHLTVKSDVYSFGVVLLELITGRRAIDADKDPGERSLVSWAVPMFGDQQRFPELVDPLIGAGRYPARGLKQAVALAALCLQDDATVRPVMGDVIRTLDSLAEPPGGETPPPPVPAPAPKELGQLEMSDAERQLAVAEAIKWGFSKSRRQ